MSEEQKYISSAEAEQIRKITFTDHDTITVSSPRVAALLLAKTQYAMGFTVHKELREAPNAKLIESFEKINNLKLKGKAKQYMKKFLSFEKKHAESQLEFLETMDMKEAGISSAPSRKTAESVAAYYVNGATKDKAE